MPRVRVVIASAVLYGALLVLYWPSLGFGPLSLDDAGQLTLAAQQPASQIWMADRYGHVRPIKSALFWLLARHDGDWGAVRAGMLAALIVATVLVQRSRSAHGSA